MWAKEIVINREIITATSAENAEAAFREMYHYDKTNSVTVRKLGPA